MTMMMKKVPWLALVLPLALTGPASGDEKKAEDEKAPAGAVTPLSVQVVFVRYQGEKKISSLPYALNVNAAASANAADSRAWTRLRIGLRVPLTTPGKEGPQVLLKNVGTSIDCSAEPLDDGRFKLNLNLDQSSVSTADGNVRWSETDSGRQPLMPFIELSTTAYLRPGQTAQYTMATDPFTGETVKVEVTLNLVK